MDSETAQLTPEAIGRLCLEKFESLPKTGKPTKTQWTVMAGVVMYNMTNKNGQVVSLGMGTKCIGSSRMCKNGWILNDSHAEVLARRGFLRYLYHQMRCIFNNGISITTWDEDRGTYRIMPEYSFHFFSSQAPCGDACIVDEVKETDDSPLSKRRKLSHELDENNETSIGTVLESSTIYTGAKLFGYKNCSNDHMAQTLGALRIKPGKGDRTLSMSCSDKLSKWCILGVQGALLSILLEKPVYMTSMTFCQNSNVSSIQRALYGRWKGKAISSVVGSFQLHEPKLQICDGSVTFPYGETETRNQPCPNGLVWCDIPDKFKPCEVVVNGKRQGCTKKALNTAEAALKISKYNLFQEFVHFLSRKKNLWDKCGLREKDMDTLTYSNAKNLAKSYQSAWCSLKTQVFGLWTEKPSDILSFSLCTLTGT